MAFPFKYSRLDAEARAGSYRQVENGRVLADPAIELKAKLVQELLLNQNGHTGWSG
jgi:hypothetical protein